MVTLTHSGQEFTLFPYTSSTVSLQQKSGSEGCRA